MIVTFDGVTLNEPKVQPQRDPLLNENLLVSGETKLTTSSIVKTSWQISCICTYAELTALIAKMGTSGSLVINGTTYTKCSIAKCKEKELNPNYTKVTLTFKQDTTT